jgi:hypothetical protein
MEGVTLTLVTPKQLDLHEAGIIGIDQDYGSARQWGENTCAILGVTRSPSLLGVVDQSVSL